MNRWQNIIKHIEQTTGRSFSVDQQQSMAGGSINKAFLLVGQSEKYFVKTNATGQKAMFEAEARGLQALASSNTLKVPKVIC